MKMIPLANEENGAHINQKSPICAKNVKVTMTQNIVKFQITVITQVNDEVQHRVSIAE